MAGRQQEVKPTGSAAVGISMSGSAALILAAYHPQQFGLRRLVVGPDGSLLGDGALHDQPHDG